MARITIVGTGYVGLCTGLVFAEHGHDVTFVDVDERKLAAVREGRAHFFEPGVDALMAKLKSQYHATSDLASAVRASEFTFLCVGTPQGADGAIDLGYVRKAASDVGAALKDAAAGAAPHVVITKSTVVPGTADEVVAPAVEAASGLREGEGFHVASNPEFLKEGSAMKDALQPDRIVVGARSADAAARVMSLYEKLDAPRIVVAPKTAEMIKYAANAFLATKIAFSNEMANVCERIGVDWYDVVRGIGPDPRIGPLFLRAGVGFGGSCFPKDVAAIAHVARDAGVPSGILDAVLRNNEEQSAVAVRMLDEELGGVRGKRVALLGLAFKPETDDVRETRALPLWRALTEAGADVVAYDPKGGQNFLQLAPEARLATSLDAALEGADGVVVQTEWDEFVKLDPASLVKRMRTPVVVDGRRTFDPAAMRKAGVRYRAIGLGQ